MGLTHIVYPIKYALWFIMLCNVVVMKNSYKSIEFHDSHSVKKFRMLKYDKLFEAERRISASVI